MENHTVALHGTSEERRIEFAPQFNVAVPFIDRHIAEGRAGKEVIRTLSGSVTYGELHEWVNRYGNALDQLGIGRGERVLLVIKDCAEFFYAFWGAIKAGIVPVPINTMLRPSDLAYMIDDSGCAGIAYSSDFADLVLEALAAAQHRPARVLPVDGDGETLTAAAARADAALEAVPASAEDDCFWLYSSGTTGRPKGAVHAHRDMVYTSQCYSVDTLGAIESDVFYSIPRLFFAYGLGCAMTFPLWVGGTVVLDPRRPTPDTAAEIIGKLAPTVFAAVPTFYAAFLQAMEQSPLDLSCLRRCVSGGEAISAELQKRWMGFAGVPLMDGIGSTEVLHIYISNRFDDIRPGSTGKPVTTYRVRIVDEQDNDVEDDTQGRLLVNGLSIAKYYWNKPELTAKAFRDGWYDSGDTYYRDAEGYYYYCGRNDDMLKVGGMWVSPFEVESALIEKTYVLEAAVVGRADESGNVKPEAWVVLKGGETGSDEIAAELVQHCKSRLAPYKYPRRVRFVEELPKTATGKIQRFKLRDLDA